MTVLLLADTSIFTLADVDYLLFLHVTLLLVARSYVRSELVSNVWETIVFLGLAHYIQFHSKSNTQGQMTW